MRVQRDARQITAETSRVPTGSGGTLQSPLARCRRTGQEPCRVLRVDLTVSMGTAKMMSDHVDDGCDEVEFTQESAEDEVVNYLEEGVAR